jgi:hypothetical protein
MEKDQTMKGVQTETIIRHTKGFNGRVVVRAVMAVENGVAWTEETKFEKPHFKWQSWHERDTKTGKIVLRGRFIILEGEKTGDCDECHQMPCHHTAFLLGWTSEVKD